MRITKTKYEFAILNGFDWNTFISANNYFIAFCKDKQRWMIGKFCSRDELRIDPLFGVHEYACPEHAARDFIRHCNE